MRGAKKREEIIESDERAGRPEVEKNDPVGGKGKMAGGDGGEEVESGREFVSYRVEMFSPDTYYNKQYRKSY